MIESPQFLILFLLITTSVCMDTEWSVTYGPSQHICAREGSVIIMQCRYTHPPHLKVKDVHWVKQDMENPMNFSTVYDYSDRVIVNRGHKSCFLLLTNVSVADALQQYQCKITTNNEAESYIGEPGISLSVTDLDIVLSKERNIVNGDFVTFTCATTCDLPGNLSYMWSKDGRLLEGKNDKQMVLGPVHVDYDVGIYSCAIKGSEDLPSPFVDLEIQTHDISNDGKPLGSGETAGVVILSIVVVGFVMGLRFLRFYYCLKRIQTPQPATVRVTVLPVATPIRYPYFQAWRNPDGTEPLVS